MAPREKARNKSSKGQIEEYALIIGGAPSTCRWQELKDFIREYAPHIRQAEIYEDADGKPTGHGSVIITRLEEAQRAYRALSRKGWDGHCITVVLAKRVNGGALENMEGPTTSPELPTPTPSSAPYTNTFRQMSEGSPPISPRSDSYPAYSSAVEPHPAYYATAGAGPPMLAARHRADAPSVMTMPFTTVTVPPSYAPYQNAHYVNVSSVLPYHQNVVYNTASPPEFTNGRRATAPHPSRNLASRPQAPADLDAAIVTPNRTVFLTKLPYSAVGPAVRRLLESYGRVERCDVPLDKTSPNKIQGTAIAKFKDTNDAARAIRNLNGYKWKGVTISARWDRDSASTLGAYSAAGKPVQARHSATGTSRVADARSHAPGTPVQRRRPGEGPLIVNGSRGDVAPCRSRRDSKDDDSDSSDADDDDEAHSGSDGTLSLPPDWILANAFKKTSDLLFVAQAVGPIDLLPANVDEMYSLVMESKREREPHSCA